jgi:hypothetical protein
VASFSLGGIDLAALLNTALEGAGGTSGEYNIYTINLPGTTFAALAAGTPGLSLDLDGPGLGVLGNTDFNAHCPGLPPAPVARLSPAAIP